MHLYRKTLRSYFLFSVQLYFGEYLTKLLCCNQRRDTEHYQMISIFFLRVHPKQINQYRDHIQKISLLIHQYPIYLHIFELHTLIRMCICMNTYMYKNQPCEHSHIFFQVHFREHDWGYVNNLDIFHSHADSILRKNSLHTVHIPVSHNVQCMSKFHNYSFNNTMLIAMQKPGDTHIPARQEKADDGRGAVPHNINELVGKP